MALKRESATPQQHVPSVADAWDHAADPWQWQWADGTVLPPLQLADGSGPAQWATKVTLCYNQRALFIRFDCVDRDIWGTYTKRDEPIYDEEVVELFIGPCFDPTVAPATYYEFEVSPNGVLLDVLAHNPSGERKDMQLDFAWDCPGLQWGAVRNDAANQWSAYMAIPWTAMTTIQPLPTQWYANIYRIERPRGGTPEFSCWSPTMTEPADFHKPTHFGLLTLDSVSI